MRKFQCLLFVLKRLYICYYMICMTVLLRQSLNSFTKMQLYNYQGITYQYIVYARKKIDIFMKCLYSNSFIRLDSPYD